MRLLVSGGGTGGHVYPILAVVEQLGSESGSSLEVCYMGSASGIEATLAIEAGLPFRGISTARLRGSAPWSAPWRLGRLAWGTAQATSAIASLAPQIVFATGGYVCAPLILAAWLRNVPSLMFLPDLTPGVAIRLLARFTTRVAVSFARSREFFATGKSTFTGYPVRARLFEADKLASRKRLGLDERQRTLLVFGGSQGAHNMNLDVSASLVGLLKICQVVHISGKADEPWLRAQRAQLPQGLAGRYHVYAYLHNEMIDALAAADLVVARAGAATTAEFPALGLPSILIPYPYAGRHQESNADYMVEKEAAIKVDDGDLTKGILLRTVTDLLEDRLKLVRLGRGARRLAQPDAAQQIARLLRETARAD